ncbi:hypothetical protein BU15DRAFT_64984 [Melanogaster broomeanus]|nr:hypothetical protein BU15DRAFT_64984 [Melanogaster broomeanus]
MKPMRPMRDYLLPLSNLQGYLGYRGVGVMGGRGRGQHQSTQGFTPADPYSALHHPQNSRARLTSATPGLQDKSRHSERWEKGGSIEELEAPDFRHNASTDLIRQHAAEKECNREASQHAKPGTIKHMQFTFSLDHLSPVAANVAVSKPDLKPSAAFKETITRRGRPTTRANVAGDEANGCTSNTHIETEISAGSRKRKKFGSSSEQPFLRFPSLSPSPSNTMNYGEDVTNTSSRGFSIIRPTIELPLDELLSNIDATEDNQLSLRQCQSDYKVLVDSDVVMQETSQSGPLPQTVAGPLPQTVALAKVGPSAGTQGNTPNSRLNLTVKTHNAPTTHSSGPNATATSVNPAVLRGTSNNSAPGGVKAECSNCGATHTPLWHCGLNDELNCNACGLYCKLYKRPRPKSMRANHGETRTQAAPLQEMVDVMDKSGQHNVAIATPQRLHCGGKTTRVKPSVTHAACSAVFAEGQDGRDVLVESNVGHGGLGQVVMMLENKQVLPKGYFKKPSSRIDFAGYNLCVPVAVEDFIPGEPNTMDLEVRVGIPFSAATFPEPVLVPKRPSPLVLCFSGQGPQHWQQGRDLYYTFRVSRDTIDECDLGSERRSNRGMSSTALMGFQSAITSATKDACNILKALLLSHSNNAFNPNCARRGLGRCFTVTTCFHVVAVVVVHLRFRSIPITFPSPSVVVAPPWHPVPLRNVVTLHSKKPRRLNPTIELPLDELLSNINAMEDNHVALQRCQNKYKVLVNSDVVMQETSQSSMLHMDSQTPRNNYDANLATPPPSQAVKGALPQTVALAKSRLNAPTTRSSGPGTTDTSINPAVLRGTGATHTPLWRRGLNDELNCNTYGFYCKLHKCPRHKSMRAKRGETRTQAVPRQEMVDVMDKSGQHGVTTATPQRLWRKDDEGKPICNA